MHTVDWPPAGAILNRHDGEVTPEGLVVEIRGRAPAGAQVTVNGQPTTRDGATFRGRAVLGDTRNTVAVWAEEEGHGHTIEWPLRYDRHSFPRYRFSLDDNILFLRDLARSDARSLFEHPYLAFWQRMHREYGTKVHINLYLECPGFHLSQFPARFRGEWQENADWLQLSFHARADKPDKPYLQAPSHQVVADCDAVCNEILRFAGEELLSPFTTIHWAEATREACRALRQRGVRGLVGIFLPDGINDVARWRAERAGDTEGRTLPPPGEPSIGYYLDAAQCAYLRGHDYWHDPTEDLFFITHDLVVNSVGTEEVVPFLEDVAADPHRGEVIELIVHEQYFCPETGIHQPDIAARCEKAIRWVTLQGLRPVFYREGFLGSPGGGD